MSFKNLTGQQKSAVLDMASALDSFWAIFLSDSDTDQTIEVYLDELARDYLKRAADGGAA